MRYKGHEGRHAGWRSPRVLSANAFHVTRMRCKAMEAGTGRPSRRSVPGPGYTRCQGSESYCVIRKTAKIIEYVRLFRRAFAIWIVYR